MRFKRSMGPGRFKSLLRRAAPRKRYSKFAITAQACPSTAAPNSSNPISPRRKPAPVWASPSSNKSALRTAGISPASPTNPKARSSAAVISNWRPEGDGSCCPFQKTRGGAVQQRLVPVPVGGKRLFARHRDGVREGRERSHWREQRGRFDKVSPVLAFLGSHQFPTLGVLEDLFPLGCGHRGKLLK